MKLPMNILAMLGMASLRPASPLKIKGKFHKPNFLGKRTSYYCRPLIQYNNGIQTRCSRGLALNLLFRKQIIILKGK
jgi:hypothetical protein